MFTHRRGSWIDRFRLGLADVRRMAEARWTGPCGHEVNGDAKSWSCPKCGSSGSES